MMAIICFCKSFYISTLTWHKLQSEVPGSLIEMTPSSEGLEIYEIITKIFFFLSFLVRVSHDSLSLEKVFWTVYFPSSTEGIVPCFIDFNHLMFKHTRLWFPLPSLFEFLEITWKKGVIMIRDIIYTTKELRFIIEQGKYTMDLG